MGNNELHQLLALGIVAVIALGVVVLLLRWESHRDRHGDDMVLGYPPRLFPAQELTSTGSLALLVAAQDRLMAVYYQVRPQSDLAIWLRTFLLEFREIMNTAYQVAAVTRCYGQNSRLDELVAEVEQIEAQVAEQVMRRLLVRDGGAQNELLNGRLATLRMCAHELANLPDAPLHTVPYSHSHPL